MADWQPIEPTIRLPTCRPDGRCPECGDPGWIVHHSQTKGFLPVWQMPCGCALCINWSCMATHSRALLTEALRQLSEAQAKLHPVRHVDPGFVIAPEDESNG